FFFVLESSSFPNSLLPVISLSSTISIWSFSFSFPFSLPLFTFSHFRMLKYKTEFSRSSPSRDEIKSSSISVNDTSSYSNLSRSLSLSSISSLESINSINSNWGTLKIDVSAVTQFSHYKTIRVAESQDVSSIIPLLLSKLKLSSDHIKYELSMEVKTRRDGGVVISYLTLDPHSKPLQLEKCLPNGMSRFILLSILNSK
ncbi:hypothetical protein PRIPAC_84893, partial [Pristionchus pacificus]|uniref:Ras-associating domain-containing protein n=1 Tax=Pristionchus pacificus TaxID=54126 RepID=A0A8R1Z8R5_PRIPA